MAPASVRWRRFGLAWWLALAVLAWVAAVAGTTVPAQPDTRSPCVAAPDAPRLDHVVVVVGDLDEADRSFRKAGFTLKAWRQHSNGLLNRHVKFLDGTSIELMSVVRPPGDRMAREYKALVDDWPGGAYAALRVYALDEVAAAARRLRLDPRRSSSGPWRFLSFEPGTPAAAVFFVAGGLPADEAPWVLKHANAAESLVGASVQGGNELVRLLEAVGAARCPQLATPGEPSIALALAAGRIEVLSAGTPGRGARLVGATVATPGAGGRNPRRMDVMPRFWIAID